MAKTDKYGKRSLEKDFPTDEACLEFVFDNLHSRECSCGGKYSLLKGRKKFQCSRCRFQIAPTAGTIFHKSDTPLTLWFHALWVFSNAKSGISAKEMERQLEVTYKTAWRMLRLIREALGKDFTRLGGDVEMDTAYFGGKGDAGPNNSRHSAMMREKSIVAGAVERGGAVRTRILKNNGAAEQGQFLREAVDPLWGTRLMTNGTNTLHNAAMGYDRHTVNHSKKEWARGDVHINTMESFWSHVKRSIKGTHKVVSKQHLQGYLDAFAFQWSNSRNDRQRFAVLLGSVLLASKM